MSRYWSPSSRVSSCSTPLTEGASSWSSSSRWSPSGTPSSSSARHAAAQCCTWLPLLAVTSKVTCFATSEADGACLIRGSVGIVSRSSWTWRISCGALLGSLGCRRLGLRLVWWTSVHHLPWPGLLSLHWPWEYIGSHPCRCKPLERDMAPTRSLHVPGT